MKKILAVAKAMGDQTRLRILMLLEPGELCLCQLVTVLGLSPSTVSKHLSILTAAGLISCRKEGRWHYYQLAGREAPVYVREALKWVRTHLNEQAEVLEDRKACRIITKKSLDAVCACYR